MATTLTARNTISYSTVDELSDKHKALQMSIKSPKIRRNKKQGVSEALARRHSSLSLLLMFAYGLLTGMILTYCGHASVNAFPVAPAFFHCYSRSIARQPTQQMPLYHADLTTALFAKKKKKRKPGDSTICVNRLAYRNYEIVDSLEAGISLKGTEVKSIRDGKMNLRDGYVKPTNKANGNSLSLHNVHIGKHTGCGEFFQHEEKRPRELLVHKEQARKLKQQTEQKGMTIVPLKAYFKQNRVKIEIALCRGKNVRDKRATIKEREAKREENRIIKTFRL